MLAETLIAGLIGLLHVKITDRHHEETQRNLALSTIMTAVTETRIYIRRFERTNRRNQKAEEKLCQLWMAAAAPVSHFDSELAERCTMKSDYWLNPENYSKKKLVKFRLGLNHVYKDAKKLL